MIGLIEEVLSELYKIEIPLPQNPLGSLNSYVVKGNEGFLIIDTGMNRRECERPMLKSLERLDVNLSETHFFITHMHADHLGLAGKLPTDTSKVYFNEPEALYLSSENEEVSDRLQEFSAFYRLNGFPEGELKGILETHPGSRYSSERGLDFCILREGDKIEVGDYSFECIETPGHSPGHMCLYERNRKILISGDHVLFDITPNITWWPVMENALEEYLKNLDKIRDLDVDFVLPGHRRIQKGLGKRIEELQDHHKNRLNEVLSALEEGDKNAWEVAPHITWDIDFHSWEELPPVQKWFAVGETIAHLIYLEDKGKIKRVIEEDKIAFSPI